MNCLKAQQKQPKHYNAGKDKEIEGWYPSS